MIIIIPDAVSINDNDSHDLVIKYYRNSKKDSAKNIDEITNQALYLLLIELKDKQHKGTLKSKK
jgi:hypothetical protein